MRRRSGGGCEVRVRSAYSMVRGPYTHKLQGRQRERCPTGLASPASPAGLAGLAGPAEMAEVGEVAEVREMAGGGGGGGSGGGGYEYSQCRQSLPVSARFCPSRPRREPRRQPRRIANSARSAARSLSILRDAHKVTLMT
jgi:hypothetical protein